MSEKKTGTCRIWNQVHKKKKPLHPSKRLYNRRICNIVCVRIKLAIYIWLTVSESGRRGENPDRDGSPLDEGTVWTERQWLKWRISNAISVKVTPRYNGPWNMHQVKWIWVLSQRYTTRCWRVASFRMWPLSVATWEMQSAGNEETWEPEMCGIWAALQFAVQIIYSLQYTKVLKLCWRSSKFAKENWSLRRLLELNNNWIWRSRRVTFLNMCKLKQFYEHEHGSSISLDFIIFTHEEKGK